MLSILQTNFKLFSNFKTNCSTCRNANVNKDLSIENFRNEEQRLSLSQSLEDCLTISQFSNHCEVVYLEFGKITKGLQTINSEIFLLLIPLFANFRKFCFFLVFLIFLYFLRLAYLSSVKFFP